jgi:8-oxo-dGTP pyrophosphatase MutT (NUDIX family)
MVSFSPENEQDFSPSNFRERAAARLLAEPQPDERGAFLPPRGDHAIAGAPPQRNAATARPAAVLVPIVARRPAATVLLTKRASHLRDHSGQIAFPGGKIDPSDASPRAAALREASEEIGLRGSAITPLGYLEDYLTATGFRIVPLVALIDPDGLFVQPSAEVEDVFETPLAFLMNPGNHQRHAREWQGSLWHYYAMPHGERYIWGITAGIIRNLYERLYLNVASPV